MEIRWVDLIPYERASRRQGGGEGGRGKMPSQPGGESRRRPRAWSSSPFDWRWIYVIIFGVVVQPWTRRLVVWRGLFALEDGQKTATIIGGFADGRRHGFVLGIVLSVNMVEVRPPIFFHFSRPTLGPVPHIVLPIFRRRTN